MKNKELFLRYLQLEKELINAIREKETESYKYLVLPVRLIR